MTTGRFGVVFGAVVLAALWTAAPRTAGRAEPTTFTRDVAPIFYTHCVECHRPTMFAPMSLLTYEAARPWARSIRQRVAARTMPPWGADPAYGEFGNDPRLSEAEVRTVLAWVDAGAPRGNAADLPPPPVFPDDEAWHIGEPDLIVQIPKDHVVPANSGDLWIDYIADSGLTEDRYLQAVEAKPGPGARSSIRLRAVTSPVTLPLMITCRCSERLPLSMMVSPGRK